MFDNQRYMTRGIELTLSMELIMFLWALIDEMRNDNQSMDYLQVFKLSPAKDAASASIQVITHTQENPDFQAFYQVCLPNEPIQAKVYVIDDITHSTMLLAEEY